MAAGDEFITANIDFGDLFQIISQWKRRSGDMRRPFVIMSRWLLSQFAIAHREKRSVLGDIWPPNKDAPPGRRFPDGTGEQMTDTGALRRSFTIGAPGNIRQVGANELTVGTSIPYYIHHHFGAPRSGLPMRRIIDWSDEQMGPELIAVLIQYLFGGELE